MPKRTFQVWSLFWGFLFLFFIFLFFYFFIFLFFIFYFVIFLFFHFLFFYFSFFHFFIFFDDVITYPPLPHSFWPSPTHPSLLFFWPSPTHPSLLFFRLALPTLFRRFPKIFPKISEDFRRFPKISEEALHQSDARKIFGKYGLI